jgi:hypothetical protein
VNDAAVWVPVPAMFYWGWLVPLIFGTICGWRYHRDKVRLGKCIWFSLFFYSFLTMLAITILGSNVHWLIIISGTLFVLLILLIGLILPYKLSCSYGMRGSCGVMRVIHWRIC